MTRSFAHRFSALALAAALTLTGCSSTTAREDRPTITPATPAVAPEPGTPPAGRITPAAAGEGLAFDPVSRRLAAIAGNGVVIYTVDGGLKEVATIPAAKRVNQIVASNGGGFLVALEGAVQRVKADGTGFDEAARRPVDGDVLTVAPFGGGPDDVLAGTADGRIVELRGSQQPRTITGPVEASRLLVRGDKVAVVDRRQASLTEVDVPAGKAGQSLRVGRGITNAAIDPYGRIFAVDTGENQVIGYTLAPFMERFLYPVSGSPWAVDYDESSKLMWVTQTATNQVVGYALGSGMPEQKQSHPTVRQPNAITVDATTGTLYVQSATGGGVQAIPTR